MLLKHLLYDYERQNRPVLNETEPLVLTFGITLQQIIDVVSVEHKLLLRFSSKEILNNEIESSYFKNVATSVCFISCKEMIYIARNQYFLYGFREPQ